MKLSPVTERFVLHWGEMGTTWGVNRTIAQIHALLFVAARSMHAEEIAETLNVARSNVSMSLRELQNWGLVKTVHLLGDRRDHFEVGGDVWDLFGAVVRGRKQREFDPTVRMLRALVETPEFEHEAAATRTRMRETMVLVETLSTWADEMLRLKPETLVKILKLGARIQKLMSKARGKKSANSSPVGG